MLFNSIDFLIFLPIVCLVYFIFPKKYRYLWLLVASYYFYMCWNAKYAILIAASTVITYLCSLRVNYLTKLQIDFSCDASFGGGGERIYLLPTPLSQDKLTQKAGNSR